MRANGQRGAWRRRLDRHPSGRRTDDTGFTLVEVVMTITLIAVTIIPIIDATWTSVRASTTSREVAEMQTVLQNAADRINRAPTLCNYKNYVEAAAVANGWRADQASATYQYYTPGATALFGDEGTWSAAGPDPDDACKDGVRSARLIQLVTISVRSETGSINRSIQVVKSDV